MIRILRTSILALLVLPMAAQTTDISAGGGIVLALNSLQKATHNALGFMIDGDYHTHIYGGDAPVRMGLSLGAFPGQERFGLKTSLTLAQAHGDVFVGTGMPSLQGFVGLSFNRYFMSRSGRESSIPDDMDHHFPVRDAKGLKLGLRLGLAYACSRSVTTELVFQQTELAGKDLEDPMVRQGGINPAWLQLSIHKRF